jgi:cell volume regulation protein A
VSASIIIIGFLGNLLFEKKGIPDMLFLIFLGILLGPVLKIFDPSVVSGLAPYVAALALVFILFDGGIRLNIRRVLSDSPRAVLLAVLGFLFSMLGVAIVMITAFNTPLPYGLLFGSIYGGSSSIVVVSLACRIKISEKSRNTLILESATTDILCIVVSLSIIGVILTGKADFVSIGAGITGKFLIGFAFGMIFGFLWLSLLRRLSRFSFSYMLTLAIALSTYAVSEILGGSGALSCLIFGLILGNEKELLHFFRVELENGKAVDKGLRRFESEIAFFVKTFFFVFLGIIASITDISFIFFGILISVLLLVVRFCAVRLATLKSKLRNEQSVMTVVLTRGLAAAVLATLPFQYGLSYSYLFINLAVVIIVSTAVIATAGVIVISRKSLKKQKNLQ